MKDSKRMAMALVLGSVALVAGCTGRLRHQDSSFRDSVKLPSAPKIDASPTPTGPVGSIAPGAAPTTSVPTPSPFDH